MKHYIGVRLRAARASKGLTQEQLAERIERTVETVSNIERGRTLPGLDTLEALSRCLDVPLRDFFPRYDDDEQLSRRRLDLELKLRDMLRTLSDDALTAAAIQVEALVKLETTRGVNRKSR